MRRTFFLHQVNQELFYPRLAEQVMSEEGSAGRSLTDTRDSLVSVRSMTVAFAKERENDH